MQSSPDSAVDPPPPGARHRSWRRFGPILVLAVGLCLLFAFDLDHYVSFASVRAHRDLLESFVAANPLLAGGLFVLVYAAAVAVSVPGAAILTILGGFLFGLIPGAGLSVCGATIGSCAVFLAARTALGDWLLRRAQGWVGRVEAGFRRNAVSYLLTLRLIPVVPFWLVNLLPAFFGVSLKVFALTTLLGILPGSIVYASIGSGLGSTFDREEVPDLTVVFSPEILLPLIGLAVLSLLPVLLRLFRKRNES